MSDERAAKLAEHLCAAAYDPGRWNDYLLAQAIIADPQAHIDALVEAGVLAEQGREYPPAPFKTEDGFITYSVVKPHKHEWRVIWTTQDDEVLLRCLNSCPAHAEHLVPNRLPLVVPAS